MDCNDRHREQTCQNWHVYEKHRAGQPREIVDGAGISELAYDYASRLASATYTNSQHFWLGGTYVLVNSPLAGITISNHFNPHFGRDVLKVSSTNGWSLEDDYGYDSGSGRLIEHKGFDGFGTQRKEIICFSGASSF